MAHLVNRTQSESAAPPAAVPRTELPNIQTGDGPVSDTPQSSPGQQTLSPSNSVVFDDTVIPASHDYRTLVLCFDGTGDQFDADNSNIVEFFSMLKKDDRSQQMVYYQAGIGTYTIPQIATPFVASFDKTLDEAFGVHLDAHVMGGYEFLMENYQAEDKICIFGFSRGAYTARALAGMIHKVGLLPASNHQQVPFAYKMFSTDDEVGWAQSTAFKKAFSIDVEIEFVGVWDTVASVGLFPRHLPFTASNTAIRYFRHALSLDERRAKFKANYFRPSPPHICDLGTKPGEMPQSNQKRHPHSHHQDHHHTGKVSKRHLERDYENGEKKSDALEVWFAGCHCDVGGGSVKNGTRNSLARIPLRWMIRQCFLANTGIMFHRDAFKNIGMDPSSLYPIVLPRPPPIFATPRVIREATDATLVGSSQAEASAKPLVSEEEEDLADALSPIYDMLKIAKAWWIVEVLPLRQRVKQKKNLSWTHKTTMNLGKPRIIPNKSNNVYVHRSVKIRMDARGLNNKEYTPKAKFPVDPTWVD
ncbi:hypothetical protein BV25DRAFT_1395427 [Artomyces pyxidatus]|uniref:Uncharacterized protein n=1 Tax=Artomyces pyxidatus TaxID=48021 RepID=A0ACB8TDL9_9AGAM|nr:hypothetical protein BV25DRAFT_1395427 [Artomyces pyxidatus]